MRYHELLENIQGTILVDPPVNLDIGKEEEEIIVIPRKRPVEAPEPKLPPAPKRTEPTKPVPKEPTKKPEKVSEALEKKFNTDTDYGIVAWRAWYLSKDDTFQSGMHQMEWLPGKYVEADKLPAENNTNGIYCLNSLQEILKVFGNLGTPVVIGTIYIWGTIVKGEHGYRTQFAQPRTIEYFLPQTDQNLERIKSLQVKYRVPQTVQKLNVSNIYYYANITATDKIVEFLKSVIPNLDLEKSDQSFQLPEENITQIVDDMKKNFGISAQTLPNFSPDSSSTEEIRFRFNASPNQVWVDLRNIPNYQEYLDAIPAGYWHADVLTSPDGSHNYHIGVPDLHSFLNQYLPNIPYKIEKKPFSTFYSIDIATPADIAWPAIEVDLSKQTSEVIEKVIDTVSSIYHKSQVSKGNSKIIKVKVGDLGPIKKLLKELNVVYKTKTVPNLNMPNLTIIIPKESPLGSLRIDLRNAPSEKLRAALNILRTHLGQADYSETAKTGWDSSDPKVYHRWRWHRGYSKELVDELKKNQIPFNFDARYHGVFLFGPQ